MDSAGRIRATFDDKMVLNARDAYRGAANFPLNFFKLKSAKLPAEAYQKFEVVEGYNGFKIAIKYRQDLGYLGMS